MLRNSTNQFFIDSLPDTVALTASEMDSPSLVRPRVSKDCVEDYVIIALYVDDKKIHLP